MAKRKLTKRLLLIVCEGTNTEPQYFGWLAENYAYPNQIWDKIFEQTECKNDKTPLGCNATIGCKGETCLVGYIRKNYYLDYEKSHKNAHLSQLMQTLVTRQDTAFQNAVWLREQKQNRKDEIYNLNPYTDMDILVKSILGF